jgi:hypothetical protein
MNEMHTTKVENPNEWEHVRFINNEGERYLAEMDKELDEVEEEM